MERVNNEHGKFISNCLCLYDSIICNIWTEFQISHFSKFLKVMFFFFSFPRSVKVRVHVMVWWPSIHHPYTLTNWRFLFSALFLFSTLFLCLCSFIFLWSKPPPPMGPISTPPSPKPVTTGFIWYKLTGMASCLQLFHLRCRHIFSTPPQNKRNEYFDCQILG